MGFCSGRMADELEELWSKLTFMEEGGEDIVMKNCLVMKILTQRFIVLDVLRKHLKML